MRSDRSRGGRPSNNWHHKIAALEVDHNNGNGDPNYYFALMASVGIGKVPLEHKWMLDKGATRHVMNNLAAISNSVYSIVEVRNEKYVEIYKMVTVKVTTLVDIVVKKVSTGKVTDAQSSQLVFTQ